MATLTHERHSLFVSMALKAKKQIVLQFRHVKIAVGITIGSALTITILQSKLPLPLSGTRLSDHMREVRYQPFSGNESAFLEFKKESVRKTLHMKVLRAWPADTQANRTACANESREQSAWKAFCSSLNQQTIVALEPLGRQPLFIAFVRVLSKANIPVGESVELIAGKFMLAQSMYSLPPSNSKMQSTNVTDIAGLDAIR